MAEIIGVTASAITLATLFSSCIECFSYFKAAQNCPTEAESLLVKLDCEKARLLVWANTVGILQTDPQKRHGKLADLYHENLVRRCINQITTLLTDARKLQDEYGGRTTTEQEGQQYLAILSVNSMSIFQSTKRTFFARVGTKNAVPSILSRVKWAVRDAAKFRILVLNLRDFVDNLIQLVEVPSETISGIVEEDIVSTIDIASLKLIENGCDEDSYPQWSARATEVIRDSEIGTVDRRNLLEILNDTEAVKEVDTTSSRSRVVSNSEFSKISLYNILVVLTEKCLNYQAGGENYCAESNICEAALGARFVTPFTSSGAWSLGRRLYRHLEFPFDEYRRKGMCQGTSLEGYVNVNSSRDWYKDKKFGRIYVYCGACTCAINTARLLVYNDIIPESIDIVIRIDDRLSTSCRDSTSTIDILETIRCEIEDRETRDDDAFRRIDAIDCPALEKRLYALEEDRPEPDLMLHKLIYEESSQFPTDLENVGVIIIAENDKCSGSLTHAPIHSQSRRSKAGELYKFDRRSEDVSSGYDLNFIGRLSRSREWIDFEKRCRDTSGHERMETHDNSQPNLAVRPTKRPRSD